MVPISDGADTPGGVRNIWVGSGRRLWRLAWSSAKLGYVADSRCWWCLRLSFVCRSIGVGSLRSLTMLLYGCSGSAVPSLG